MKTFLKSVNIWQLQARTWLSHALRAAANALLKTPPNLKYYSEICRYNCNLSLIACFLTLMFHKVVWQHMQSVVCSGRIVNNDFTANLPMNRGRWKRGTGKRGTKAHGWNSRDWKTQDQISRVENARPPSIEREMDKYKVEVEVTWPRPSPLAVVWPVGLLVIMAQAQ